MNLYKPSTHFLPPGVTLIFTILALNSYHQV